MISKLTLGRRVRDVRERQKLTLKETEALAGLSSTHISEIERGMTSPTIGALIRIAHALRKDSSYFIEERSLEEISITSEEDRPLEALPEGVHIDKGRMSPLTRGILGGRICAHELVLESEDRAELPCLHDGEDVCFYCVDGKVRLGIGAQELWLMPGDSVHGCLPGHPCVLTTGELGSRLLIIADPREEMH